MATASLQIFSRNLRYLMRLKGISATELSADLGVQESRLSNWLGGACYPKQAALIKLCDVLDYRDIYKLITEPIKMEGTHDL